MLLGVRLLCCIRLCYIAIQLGYIATVNSQYKDTGYKHTVNSRSKDTGCKHIEYKHILIFFLDVLVSRVTIPN